MTVRVQTHQMPWDERAGEHVDRLGRLGRRSLIAASWLGALVLVVWFVVGVVCGFVTFQSSLSATLGAGGLGSVAELLRKPEIKDRAGG